VYRVITHCIQGRIRCTTVTIRFVYGLSLIYKTEHFFTFTTNAIYNLENFSIKHRGHNNQSKKLNQANARLYAYNKLGMIYQQNTLNYFQSIKIVTLLYNHRNFIVKTTMNIK